MLLTFDFNSYMQNILYIILRYLHILVLFPIPLESLTNSNRIEFYQIYILSMIANKQSKYSILVNNKVNIL